MQTRAKFVCNSETIVKWSANPEVVPSRSYRFSAVYDSNSPEDQRFAKATPTGHVEISVDNPNVTFVPGKAYYLDFTAVD